MFDRILGPIFLRLSSAAFYITLLRYALVGVGVWLAKEGRMDPAQWETISGAILVIFTSLFGATDAGKEKVNIAGQSVAKENLPVQLQQQLEAVVPVRKSRNLLDQFLGK